MSEHEESPLESIKPSDVTETDFSWIESTDQRPRGHASD